MNTFDWIFLIFIVTVIAVNIGRRGLKLYVIGFLIALDQLGNAIIGGAPDETVSSRCARGYGKAWYWTVLGKLLNWMDPNHIQDALAHEQDDSHKPDVE